MNFAIFASTNGSDLPQIFKAFDEKRINGKIVCGIVDHEACGAREKMENKNIPVYYIPHKKKNRKEFEIKADDILKKYNIDYIICVGFMKVLSEYFVNKWQRKILNVHPALLPLFPGAHAISDALKAGAKETGATIHFIDTGVDTGPILMKKSVIIENNETEESLKKKIQAIEQELYPIVLEKISKGEIK